MTIKNQHLSQLKQEIIEILDSLQKRTNTFSFRKLVQPLIKKNSLLNGRGWEEIKEKYNKIDGNFTLEDLSDHKNKLLNIYKKSIKFSSCGVMIYEIDKEKISDIEKTLKTTPSSLFLKKFPYPLSEDALKKMDGGKSQLVKINNNEEYLSLIFCYRRIYKEREKIDPKEIMDLDLKYSEIYGIKTGYAQAFDKVLFDKKTGYVYFCIDKCIDQNLTNQEISFKTSEYIRFITEESELDIKSFQKPINFFPLIKEFYNENNGIVTELNHITSTNSKKNEKMNSGKPEDLRQELFHKGGVKEVANTDIYLIEKKWESSHNIGSPTILLSGQATQIYLTNPQLNHAFISDYCFLSDLKFLLDKLKTKEDESLK